MISYPNTKLMCCPTGDGAAAVVLVPDSKLRTLDPDIRRRAVRIRASVMTSDPWCESGQVQPDVNTLTRHAADSAYETAGIGPDDLDLVELHDCFATAELIHYDNLRLCDRGQRVTSFRPVPHCVTESFRSTYRVGFSRRGIRSGQRESRISSRW